MSADTRALEPYPFEAYCVCRSCDWATPPVDNREGMMRRRQQARRHARRSGHEVEVIESWVRAYAPSRSPHAK